MLLLIIDDDPDDVELFCEAVEDLDNKYKCCFAYDADMAIQFLNETPDKPDYIFLDINLPRINGKQFLMRLKREAKYKDIPVIIYTTLKQQKQMEELYSLGAKTCIIKPTNFHDLKKVICEAMELKYNDHPHHEK